MMFLEKILGKKLLNWIIFLVIGIVLIVAPVKGDLTPKQVGYTIIVISILGIVYEGNLRYYIKIKKNTKEFKSKKEVFIANYLDKKGIKYIYEKPVSVGKDVLKPDFYLPEYDVYVEYWGKWSNDFEYRKERRHKKQLYDQYEYNLVELFPDNLESIHQLDWKFTERLLKILKKERM